MIALVRGEGGLIRRASGEVVPLLAGLAAGMLALPFVGALPAALVALGAWILLSGVLVAVRRHTALRRLYRLLVLAHVAFWSWQGLAAPPPRDAGEIGSVAAALGRSSVPFRAGMADAPFEGLEDAPLAGWSQRPRRRAWPAFGGLGALGRLSLDLIGPPAEGEPPRVPLLARPQAPGETLGARALVLLPSGGEPALAFVRLDLVVLEPTLQEAVLARLKRPSLTPATLVLAATHTHSGPGGFHRSPFAQVAGTDHYDARRFEAVVAATVEAVERATDAARPARLAVVQTRARDEENRPLLGRNRRRDPSLVDDGVLALRLDDASDARPLGVLLHAAVHPTLLRPRHLAFGRDLAGALEDELSAVLPGTPPVLFVNGALGDVAPRGADLAGTEACRDLGRRFASRIAQGVMEAPALERVRVRAARVERDLGTPRLLLAWGGRRQELHDALTAPWGARDALGLVADGLSLPANVLLWSLGLTEARAGFSFAGTAGVRIDLDRSVAHRRHAFGAIHLLLDGAPPAPRRQALFLWQGGEPTVALGRAWQRRAEALGLPTPFLLALANGNLAYLTTPEEYDGGGYEALATLYGPRTSQLVEEALFEAVRRLALEGAR